MPYSGHHSQIGQDIFILCCLKNKKNGYFLEIGSHDAIFINNTYLLESEYGWKGILVEYNDAFHNSYKEHRGASRAIIQDATKVDYRGVLEGMKFPEVMDYLQVDLEVEEGTTIQTLELLNSTVFDKYTFRVVTFEHDIYTGNFFSTRSRSRQILESRGYVRLFSDIDGEGNHEDGGLGHDAHKRRVLNEAAISELSGLNEFCFEDWWVHPDHVDMDHIRKVFEGFDTSTIYNYKHILKRCIEHV